MLRWEAQNNSNDLYQDENGSTRRTGPRESQAGPSGHGQSYSSWDCLVGLLCFLLSHCGQGFFSAVANSVQIDTERRAGLLIPPGAVGGGKVALPSPFL